MQAEIGKRYRHYKGDTYKVLAIALDEETLNKKVVYQGLHDSEEFGDKPVWIRDKEMFEEQLEVGGEVMERFTLVD